MLSRRLECNKRWELRFGAEPQRVERICNSVDTEFFSRTPSRPETERFPTVVAATRVFPRERHRTMLRAVALLCVTVVCELLPECAIYRSPMAPTDDGILCTV